MATSYLCTERCLDSMKLRSKALRCQGICYKIQLEDICTPQHGSLNTVQLRLLDTCVQCIRESYLEKKLTRMEYFVWTYEVHVWVS